LVRSLYRITRALRRSPLEAALGLAAIAAAVYAVTAPFAASRYPAMTDFPFHATQASTLRHYLDPSFHLREQFELHPIAVPYLSMWVIGAVLMLFLPMMTAIKIAGAVMVGLVPAGLAVLFYGMKKSPLLGLLGLGVAFCPLTHWGFLNHMGALGLFAATIGLTALVVDRPTRRRRVALGLTLVAIFFTHIFRFPFAIAAVVGTAIVMYPATRRFFPVVLPILPALLLFLIWLHVRPSTLAGGLGPLDIHGLRLKEFIGLLVGAFHDPAEERALKIFYTIGLWSLSICMAAASLRVLSGYTRQRFAWAAGATIVPLACAAVFFGLFLVLPMEIGIWWYVYPREATAATLLLLGAFPDLPRSLWLKIPITAALAAGGIGITQVTVKNYAKFDEVTLDFAAIIEQIPRAPKLLYLIFDHEGSTRTVSPFIHLPAYVQAEKGGWLSFHFAVFGHSPIMYRSPDEPGAVVPPRMITRWEWKPDAFNLKRDAPFFDWFLVRRRADPEALFRGDPTIERVDHVGTWWLYRRRLGAATPPGGAASGGAATPPGVFSAPSAAGTYR
jgi:hypothetical protein